MEDAVEKLRCSATSGGINKKGDQEVPGFDEGHSKDGAFWTAFLRQLMSRGLQGVKLVISDAHEGLKEAIRQLLAGVSWQRCRVHFTTNLLSQEPKMMQPMVAAFVRSIFAQPVKASAHVQQTAVAENLTGRIPKAAQLLIEAEEDILVYMAFPADHRRQLHPTNPLERLNREIRRRTDVVGIFRNAAAVICLAGPVLHEQHDERTAASRRYFSQESTSKLNTSSRDLLPSSCWRPITPTRL